MSIFKKLNEARLELQSLSLKKSGKNTYSNFTYYELGDFLPAINELCDKHGLLTRFNIISERGIEKAILTIYDVDKPTDKIEFVSPTAEVEIGRKKDGTGGAEPIQNLGGKITYMRRYMLMTAFEMVESDMVDAIKKELTDTLEKEDLQKINKAKTEEELTKVCGKLKSKYKYSLLTTEFERRKEEIKQDMDEDQSKGIK
jgi:hypothetical protein